MQFAQKILTPASPWTKFKLPGSQSDRAKANPHMSPGSLDYAEATEILLAESEHRNLACGDIRSEHTSPHADRFPRAWTGRAMSDPDTSGDSLWTHMKLRSNDFNTFSECMRIGSSYGNRQLDTTRHIEIGDAAKRIVTAGSRKPGAMSCILAGRGESRPVPYETAIGNAQRRAARRDLPSYKLCGGQGAMTRRCISPKAGSATFTEITFLSNGAATPRTIICSINVATVVADQLCLVALAVNRVLAGTLAHEASEVRPQLPCTNSNHSQRLNPTSLPSIFSEPGQRLQTSLSLYAPTTLGRPAPLADQIMATAMMHVN
ncbi:hypothetical protein BKA63DRAFT_486676 [Paraphoma chrysanthemicola]|nr:hypothetical protein BKA63DRAFT_486676 [Paraphoma chrysanthemicola]